MIVRQLKLTCFIVALQLLVGAKCFAEQSSQPNERQFTLGGDELRSDEISLSYLAKGHATAQIEGQDARIEADEIRYNDISRLLDARGHVRITRNGILTTGDRWKFNVGSHDYLVTESAVVVGLPRLVTTSKSSK